MQYGLQGAYFDEALQSASPAVQFKARDSRTNNNKGAAGLVAAANPRRKKLVDQETRIPSSGPRVYTIGNAVWFAQSYIPN